MWSVFEDHAALVRTTPAKRHGALEEIRLHMGADTLRVELKWNEVAPLPTARTKPAFDATNPAAYPGFAPYDDLLLRARSLGMRVIVTITGDAPRWATAGGRGRSFATANWKVSAGEYGRFATAVARRYSGRFGGLPPVHYFTIWNEPNHRNFLKPTSQAPAVYRKLVDTALPLIRRNGPSGVRIFVGELAPVGRAPVAMGPKEFFRKWLCLNRRLRRTSGSSACRHFKRIAADGFAHHPYGPTARVPRGRDVINMLAIRTLATYLDRARSARRFTRKLNIYNTEFGLQSNPPDRLVSTSLSRQAALINEKRSTRTAIPGSRAIRSTCSTTTRRGRARCASSGRASRPACASRAARPSLPSTRTGSRSWSRSAAVASTCGAVCDRVRDHGMYASSARAAASGPGSRPIRAGTSA